MVAPDDLSKASLSPNSSKESVGGPWENVGGFGVMVRRCGVGRDGVVDLPGVRRAVG